MHAHSVDHAGKLVNVSEDERSPRLHIMQTHTYAQTQGSLPWLQSGVLDWSVQPGGHTGKDSKEKEKRGENSLNSRKLLTLSFFSVQTYLIFIRMIDCDFTELVNVN